MVSKTTIGSSVMLWGLPRPGIKGGQRDKIRCCGPHPLEHGYKQWVHTHRFREEQGVTIIEDEVQYVLPYAPLGELVYPLVRLQLHRIFRYRQHAIRAYFAGDTSQY